jgi:hypothetical protein
MSDPAAEMEDRHAGQLKELAAMGMDMARSVHGAVMAGEGPPDADLRFARIARAVRQSIALEKRLSDEWAEERAIEGETRTRQVRELRARTRARLDEIVGRAGSDVEIEGADFAERLADAADDAGFLDRPPEEIIAQIRRDLGLTPLSPCGRGAGGEGSHRGRRQTPEPAPDSLSGGTAGATPHPSASPTPSPARGEGNGSAPATAPASRARGSPPPAGPDTNFPPPS